MLCTSEYNIEKFLRKLKNDNDLIERYKKKNEEIQNIVKEYFDLDKFEITIPEKVEDCKILFNFLHTEFLTNDITGIKTET